MVRKVIRPFRPRLISSVVLLLLALMFANLGIWQRHRAAQKADLEQRFLAAASMPLEKALQLNARFARIEATGHYDIKRHILLDNQVWHGRAGVHVFTPFYLPDGGTILVNRGWLPIPADRQQLPDIPTPKDTIVLHGILNSAPTPGRQLGAADILDNTHWPQRVTYLDIADVSTVLGVRLDPYIVQLSAAEPSGFSARNWQPVYLTARRHRAYAFQWFALTTACIGFWVFIGFRPKPHNSPRRTIH